MKKLLLSAATIALLASTSAHAQTTYIIGPSNATGAPGWTQNEGQVIMPVIPTSATCGPLCESVAYREFRAPLGAAAFYVRAGAGYLPGKCTNPAAPVALYHQESVTARQVLMGCVALTKQIKVKLTSYPNPYGSQNNVKLEWFMKNATDLTYPGGAMYSYYFPTNFPSSGSLACTGAISEFRPAGAPRPLPVMASSLNNKCNGAPDMGKLMWLPNNAQEVNPYGPLAGDTAANFHAQKFQ